MNDIKCKLLLPEYMAKQGIDQATLARRSGCTPATISLIYNGHRAGNIKIWLLIADALGCSVSDLIKLEKR